jgi:hypothetical protein
MIEILGVSPDPYPECTRLNAYADEQNTIIEFLEWCEQQGIHLARYVRPTDALFESLVPVPQSFSTLLAEYNDIDLAKVDRERRELLKTLGN